MRGFDVIENEDGQYCAMREVHPVCISIEYVDAREVRDRKGALIRSLPAGYLPTLTADERGDYAPSRGVPMSSKDVATDAAYALVPLHLGAMARSFRPFGEGADCIWEGYPSVVDGEVKFVRTGGGK